ncbi:pro-sigmaK processing inhibitor BofA family protein [Methanolobus zinderi]|uniref:Pro-sigmaK processing inhibitor BofA family protein n=1 Tax=Methanolobus zinderi TaxID=536044 RepID=A0A7D5EI91_9EURY|nr:pro-sigmaK processing inhibitor BofA family protein [Methanolobus zinderi]QLC51160.1 pro-sigmaK processing inhibitor BofA family protein [Methanolobus zinderi]
MVEELIILVVAIVVAVVLYKLLKTATKMAVNAILGLLVLIVANTVLGLGIAYDWLVILICAVAGVVGALLIIVLNYTGIAFV